MKWSFCLIFFTSFLFADSQEMRIEVIERKMEEIGSQNASHSFGADFKNDTFERGWVGAEIFGGPIYYHAKVGGSEYVYSLASGKGKVSSQEFEWDFGYQVGIGAFLPIVKWEILGTYTHFGTQDVEGKGEIPPSLLVNLKGSYYVFSQNVKSTYKIEYDAAEVVLKRSSFLGSMFGLGSSLGAKKTWIDQDQRVEYSSIENTLTEVKDRCRFEGVGPVLGMNLNWNLFWNLSLTGDVKAALLYGDFEVKHTESPLEIKGDTQLFSPNIFFSFGLNKAFPFGAAQGFISFSYEADYYFRQNQMVSIGIPKRGALKVARHAEDLTFYGVSMKLGIEF